jgi:hypothetical protein
LVITTDISSVMLKKVSSIDPLRGIAPRGYLLKAKGKWQTHAQYLNVGLKPSKFNRKMHKL